jgi:DNA-binding phage protein
MTLNRPHIIKWALTAASFRIRCLNGFEKLAEATGTPPKSLVRMLGPRGNPQARNLFGIIGYLQKQAGIELHVAAGPG